jgi:hypothetical protein
MLLSCYQERTAGTNKPKVVWTLNVESLTLARGALVHEPAAAFFISSPLNQKEHRLASHHPTRTQ